MGIRERKEREKKLRKAEILNAAKEVFLEKDFASATIEDIARKAELSPGTIYLYFKSKDDLYASLNLSVSKYLLSELEKISNNKKMKVENKILNVKTALLKSYYYDPIIFRNVLRIQTEEALSMISEDLLKQIQDVTRRCSRAVASIFEQGIKEGVFINQNTMAQTDMIWGLFTGLVLWENAKKTFNPEKDHLEPTLDLAFKTLLQGIKK